MTTGEIIKFHRQRLNLSQEELGVKCGVNKAAVQKWESGKVENLKRTTIKQLAELFEISPISLLGWEDKFNSHGKLANDVKKIEKGIRIPVLGKVAAGIPIEAIENIEDYEEISEVMLEKGEYFALKIQGESMSPKFSNGDVVIVRKQEDIESGDIAVIIVDGSDATVKKVIKQDDGILLVASNQAIYPPKFYDNKTIETLPVKILGKVVELRAKF